MVRVVSATGRLNLGSADFAGAYSEGCCASTTSVSSDFFSVLSAAIAVATGERPIHRPAKKVSELKLFGTLRFLSILFSNL
ncbi:hypothetical protein D3C75_1173660 [compost metagenome]